MSEYCSKFSCLCLQLPFSERWRLLEDEIIRPRYYEKKQFESGVKSNPMYKYDMELFSVPKSTPAEISCSIYVYSGKYIFLLLSSDSLPGQEKGFLASFYSNEAT